MFHGRGEPLPSGTPRFEILDFMPVEAADPFSGIIQFRLWPRPPRKPRLRATVYVQDPRVEARSLRVAVESRRRIGRPETAPRSRM